MFSLLGGLGWSWSLSGRLGAILGRSWPHLGVDFGEKKLENVDPRENHDF